MLIDGQTDRYLQYFKFVYRRTDTYNVSSLYRDILKMFQVCDTRALIDRQTDRYEQCSGLCRDRYIKCFKLVTHAY